MQNNIIVVGRTRRMIGKLLEELDSTVVLCGQPPILIQRTVFLILIAVCVIEENSFSQLYKADLVAVLEGPKSLKRLKLF